MDVKAQKLLIVDGIKVKEKMAVVCAFEEP